MTHHTDRFGASSPQGLGGAKAKTVHADDEMTRYFIELLRCGLSEERPTLFSEGMDWSELFQLAGWNSVTGLTWHAVKQVESVPEAIRREWERSAQNTALRQMVFEVERGEIVDALLDAGICVMPIKGALLSLLYPSTDMRSMADNDVMYGYLKQADDGEWHVLGETDDERLESVCCARDSVCKIMGSLGYTGHAVGEVTDVHDTTFSKPPFLVFEMHHALMGTKAMDTGYFSNPWRFAREVRGSSEGKDGARLLELTPEAEYVQLIAHALKHDGAGGIGVRFLADVYVWITRRAQEANGGRVKEMLRDAGLMEYESSIRGLALRVFDGPELTEDDWSRLRTMINNGTFGNLSDRMAARVQKRRREGRGWPRLATALSYLSPSESQPSEQLYRLANGRLTRWVFPAIKLFWLFGRFVHRPDQMVPMIKGLLSSDGRDSNEGR